MKQSGLNNSSIKSFFVISCGLLLGISIYYCILRSPQILALLDSTGLGKTHFIISPDGDLIKSSKKNINNISRTTNPHLVKLQKEKGYTVLFPPDDDAYDLLLSLIQQEQEAIKMAIFTFTDGIVAQALQDAMARGVRVELITDRSCLADRYTKIDPIFNHGGQVYIYNPNHNNKNLGIMHHKFIIFTKNYTGTTLVWTGSYNITKAARSYNQENIVVMNRLGAAKKFTHQFEVLRNRSFVYKPLLMQTA